MSDLSNVVLVFAAWQRGPARCRPARELPATSLGDDRARVQLNVRRSGATLADGYSRYEA